MFVQYDTRFENRLVKLNVDLELARNEASRNIIAVLVIETYVMKAEKIALETQTEEQCDAANALVGRDHVLQSALLVIAMQKVAPILTSDQMIAEQVYLVCELWVWRHQSYFLAAVNYKLDHFLSPNMKNLS